MHCASTVVDGLLVIKNCYIDLFELPTLASHREYLRVMALHKFHSGHLYLQPDILNLQPITSTRSSTSNSYRIPFARTAQFQHSFWPRTLQVWNHLPYDIIDDDHSSLNAYLDICCFILVHIHISHPLLLCVSMLMRNLLKSSLLLNKCAFL